MINCRFNLSCTAWMTLHTSCGIKGNVDLDFVTVKHVTKYTSKKGDMRTWGKLNKERSKPSQREELVSLASCHFCTFGLGCAAQTSFCLVQKQGWLLSVVTLDIPCCLNRWCRQLWWSERGCWRPQSGHDL